MEFSEEELERINAGFNSSDLLVRLADRLYNRELIIHNSDDPIQLYTVEMVSDILTASRYELPENDVKVVTDLLNEMIEHENNKKHGR